MQQFIEKFKGQITGILSGFDRLVFRGGLRRLQYGKWNQQLKATVARGMEEYLWQNKILFKDYVAHVKQVSEHVKQSSLEPFRQQQKPIIFLRLPSEDKEALARKVAAEENIDSGLVCAISSLEPSPTFEHRGTHIIRRMRPCHVLYQYQIHPEVGWMHARIQTWFPFHIQVALNGREWLSRQMDGAGLKYRQQGNCFVWIEDYAQAQQLLDQQLDQNWTELLQGFATLSHRLLLVRLSNRVGLVFGQASDLKRLMPLLVRHGMLSFSSTDVMRYFGRKVNQSGVIPAHFSATLEIDLKRCGLRVFPPPAYF